MINHDRLYGIVNLSLVLNSLRFLCCFFILRHEKCTSKEEGTVAESKNLKFQFSLLTNHISVLHGWRGWD